MFDPVATQQDYFMVLRSAASLSTVNVKWHRQMVIARELDYKMMLTTSRGGKAGTGVLVAQPVAFSENENVTGPVLTWDFPFICVEQPDIALGPNGSGLTAEEVGQRVLNVLHHFADDLRGVLRMVGKLQPERDFVFPGCVGYRATARIIGKSDQTARVANLTLAIATGTATVTCPTAGATVRYTIDGTFPALNAEDNAAAITYTAPFAVASGVRVRAAAYKTNLLNSAAVTAVAP